jgi:hypothetical protein
LLEVGALSDLDDVSVRIADVATNFAVLRDHISEPEAYRSDVATAEVHVLEAGHFALDTRANEVADLVAGFVRR